MGYTLRAVSSVLMLALMVVVAGSLAAMTILVALAVAVAVVLAFNSGSRWAVGAAIVAVCMLVAAGAGLFARRPPRKRGSGAGVSITTDEQPLFWVEIYRVAEGLGVRPPDELLLSFNTEVMASGRRAWLGLRPGARRICLGLPLVAGLTERELRAVIAHAFCRSWGPGLLARAIYRGEAIIGRVADRVGDVSRVGRIVGRYGRTFVDVSAPIIRSHELATDLLCADFAGNSATAAALGEVDALRKGWAEFMSGYAEPAAAVGCLPQDVLACFQSFLQEPERRMQLAAHAGQAPSVRPSAYDSLLTTADRLAAIEALPDDDIHDKSGPAMGLMRNPDLVIRRVEEARFGESESDPSTWEDVMPQVARVAAREDALLLARLAHGGGLGQALSVATLVELLGFGLGDGKEVDALELWLTAHRVDSELVPGTDSAGRPHSGG
jgi:hypothetical protein